MTDRTDSSTFVFVGGYTGFGPNRRGKAEGIDVFRMDPRSGALTHVETATGIENPSFLAAAPSKRYLYAGNGSPQPGGAVTALAIDQKSGHLTPINRQPTPGVGPCFVTTDREGRWVLATSYHSGNVVVYPVRPAGGLDPASDVVQHQGRSVNPERQSAPHAHSINLDRNDRFALVCDLGLDRIFVYRFDRQNGKLIPNDPPDVAAEPGVGPRHLAFHPSGRYAFVINEIASSLTSYRYDENRGTLTPIETVPTIPPGFTADNSGADVHVHPNGRFVYGSNRGQDSIVSFDFDEATARLSPLGYEPSGGRTPRNFALDADGTLLLAANQDSDNLVSFRIDPGTGRLTPTGDIAASPTPTCVKIVTMG